MRADLETPVPVLRNRGRAFPEAGRFVPIRAMAQPLESTPTRFLAWAIGLLLGVLTIKAEYIGAPKDLLSRVVPVDFLCIALMAVFFLRHRMRPPTAPALVYAAAIVISLVPGLLVTTGDASYVWVGASALLMAFGYYLVGLTLGASPVLLRGLLAGLCVGVLGQAVVVLHDVISAHQWFPDPMEGRVRGTFKTNGQLGAYSFCAAGLLLTFGATAGTRASKVACTALGLLAASFVFMASRRMGMFSMIVWAILFTILGRRFAGRRSYQALVVCLVLALTVVAAQWTRVESSFVGSRFMSALTSVGMDESFVQEQFRSLVSTSGQWFPFGFGVGRGSHISPDGGQEVHNGILAVLVELGVLGLLGFMAIVLFPLLKRTWHRRSREHEYLGVLLTTFLLVSLVFMLHNTLARDRAFLLYLGIATTIAMQESRRGTSSIYFPSPGRAA